MVCEGPPRVESVVLLLLCPKLMLDPCPTPTEPPFPPPWLPPPPEPPAPAPPPPPCAQLRLVTLTEINRDKREVKIAFTIRFDEYSYGDLQRLSAAPQNSLISGKINALGNLDARELPITVGRKTQSLQEARPLQILTSPSASPSISYSPP